MPKTKKLADSSDSDSGPDDVSTEKIANWMEIYA